MRLIDVDELVRTIDELSEGAGFYKPIYEGFSKAVKNQPTVDAVPVVRCKDCHWGRTAANRFGILGFKCDLMCVDISPEAFCSYGERKEENPCDHCMSGSYRGCDGCSYGERKGGEG